MFRASTTSLALTHCLYLGFGFPTSPVQSPRRGRLVSDCFKSCSARIVNLNSTSPKSGVLLAFSTVLIFRSAAESSPSSVSTPPPTKS